MLRLLRSTARMNFVWNCRKKICASFAVAPQTAKVRATVHKKCLIESEKALNLWKTRTKYIFCWQQRVAPESTEPTVKPKFMCLTPSEAKQTKTLEFGADKDPLQGQARNNRPVLKRPKLPDVFQRRNFKGNIWGEGCRVHNFLLRAYIKTSARDPLKGVTPRHLLQIRDCYIDSGIFCTENRKITGETESANEEVIPSRTLWGSWAQKPFCVPYIFSFFLFFWPHCSACRDLSSPTRDWILALTVKARSPNHWTAREFPHPRIPFLGYRK